jgi:hypothetical protein
MEKNRFGLLEIQFNNCYSCHYRGNNTLSFSSEKKVMDTVILSKVALSKLHKMIHVLLKAFYQCLLIQCRNWI